MVTQEEIQKIIESTDMVKLVSPYVKLSKQGHGWKGLCPFHNEKTPSFNVEPDIFSYLDLSGVTMDIQGEEYDSIYDYSQLELRDKYALFLRGNNALTVIRNNNLKNQWN